MFSGNNMQCPKRGIVHYTPSSAWSVPGALARRVARSLFASTRRNFRNGARKVGVPKSDEALPQRPEPPREIQLARSGIPSQSVTSRFEMKQPCDEAVIRTGASSAPFRNIVPRRRPRVRVRSLEPFSGAPNWLAAESVCRLAKPRACKLNANAESRVNANNTRVVQPARILDITTGALP